MASLRSATWALLLLAMTLRSAFGAAFSNPEPVEIVGYEGDAMEPFISRDDQYLFFNNSNDPKVRTKLYWAENIDGKTFRYRGEIEGVNAGALDAVASMDGQGNFYFVSPRSYALTLSTIYRGRFAGGGVENVELVEGLSLRRPGIVNFDAEISADGQTLYGVDGDLAGGGPPKWARIFIARRDGTGFKRAPDSDRLLANVNSSEVQYAPDISSDGLELFFTQLTGALFWRTARIMRATRASEAEPFDQPRAVESITGFAEGPSISNDGKRLYFHKRVDGGFRIYRVTRDRP